MQQKLSSGALAILAKMREMGFTGAGDAVQAHSYVKLFQNLKDARAAATELDTAGIATTTPRGSVKLKTAIDP